jgi:hypothetical protein
VNGRRRYPRYQVSHALAGVLRTTSDVAIEARDGPFVVALCDVGLRSGLSLCLDVFAGSTRCVLPVTVAETSPVVHAGTLRYRLRLGPVDSSDPIDADGLLVIETPVRVLDISEHGLLLDASRHAEPGTAGRVRIDIDGAAYDGDVRIVRCHRVESAADRYGLGAEFLRTERVPHGSPLRHALVTLVRAHV